MGFLSLVLDFSFGEEKRYFGDVFSRCGVGKSGGFRVRFAPKKLFK